MIAGGRGMIFANVLPDSWSLAYKINFMSAFWASLTLSIMYLILYHLIASPVPAMGATLCIGLSHMYWWVATMTPQNGKHHRELIEAADKKLYEAKSSGRHHVSS